MVTSSLSKTLIITLNSILIRVHRSILSLLHRNQNNNRQLSSSKACEKTILKNPNVSEKEVEWTVSLYAQSKGLPLAQVQDTFNEYKNNRSSNDVTAFYLGNKSDNEKLTELTTPEAVIAKHPNLTQEYNVYWSGRALTQIDQNNPKAALHQRQLDDDAKDVVNEMKLDIETGLILK